MRRVRAFEQPGVAKIDYDPGTIVALADRRKRKWAAPFVHFLWLGGRADANLSPVPATVKT